MTEAENYLKGLSATCADEPSSQTPAERCLKGEPTDVMRPDPLRTVSAPLDAKPNIGMRVLAVLIFLSLILVGTYFAKTRQPPIPILGYIIGGIGFGLGGSLWRMSKR